jgi:toxin CcdB
MQFDVHLNPIPRDRKMRPFVAILQSDVSQSGPEKIVAPLVRLAGPVDIIGRATPVVNVAGERFLLHTPGLSGMPAGRLKSPVGSIAAHRDRIVDALDWLFLGI